MTTEVTIVVSGNKAVEVKLDGPSTGTTTTVKPGTFIKQWISGEQVLSVKETGEFVS